MPLIVVSKPMLKYSINIILLFTLSTFGLKGQCLVGIFGGMNFSTFYCRSETDPHFEINFHSDNTYIIGLNFKERKDRIFNLSLNLDYLIRNVFVDAYYGGLGYWVYKDIEVNLHSINFQILPELRLGNRFAVYLNAGPYIGYIVYSQKNGESRHGNIDLEYHTEIESGSAKDLFSGFDLGVSATVGLEIPILKNIKTHPEFIYNLGLNNISTGSLGNSEGINSKNFFITLGIGYRLNSFNITDALKKL